MEGAIIIVDAPDLRASVTTPFDRSPWLIMPRLADPPTPLFICGSRCRLVALPESPDGSGGHACGRAAPGCLLNPKRLAGGNATGGEARQRAGQDATVRAALPNKEMYSGSLMTSAAQRSQYPMAWLATPAWPVRSPPHDAATAKRGGREYSGSMARRACLLYAAKRVGRRLVGSAA